jgi:hypothetical protein
VFDLACGALLAIVALVAAAGIGVVAIGAIVAVLVTLAWAGIETVLRRARR